MLFDELKIRDLTLRNRIAVPPMCQYSASGGLPSDWLGAGSLDEEQTVEPARALKAEGVDLVDCSCGGTSRDAAITAGPGFQASFTERIRREAGVMTGAVGMIVPPEQAETVLRTGQADLVLLGRESLRSAPRLHARIEPPPQYLRAFRGA